jgi:hypothetical protein
MTDSNTLTFPAEHLKLSDLQLIAVVLRPGIYWEKNCRPLANPELFVINRPFPSPMAWAAYWENIL